jgi:hypothetical protein
MKEKCDWIYVNEQLDFQCNRCGKGYSPGLPIPVDTWIGKCKQFEKTHRKCKEKCEDRKL